MQKPNPNLIFLITRMNEEDGLHIGFLVYQESDLIGWTGSGAKTGFPFLQSKVGSRLSEFAPDIWGVSCVAIKATYRGKGLADLIVPAVIKRAAEEGAKAGFFSLRSGSIRLIVES